MVNAWAIVIPSGALLFAAFLFLWKEQRELNQATLLQSGKGFEDILNGKLDQYHEQEKHELNKFKDDLDKHLSKISDLEKSLHDKMESDGQKLLRLEEKVNKIEESVSKIIENRNKRQRNQNNNEKKSDNEPEIKSSETENNNNEATNTEAGDDKDKIEDFTSCASFKAKRVPNGVFESKSSPRKYEMVRLGVSDFCKQGTTDVSVFFTWQEDGVCDDATKSHIAVRYWKQDASDSVREVASQMTGCFQDDTQRTWRFYAVRMSELEPAKLHVYTIENEMDGVQRVFQSPPLAGSDEQTKLIIFGDTMMAEARKVMNALAKLSEYNDLIIHVGDGSYATNNGECYKDGQSRNADGPCGWNCKGVQCSGVNRMNSRLLDSIRSWVNHYDNAVRGRMPWMSTMGNHDNDLHWFLSQRPCVSSALPGVHPGDIHFESRAAIESFAHSRQSMKELMALAFEYMKMPHFYSFDFGKVHVVSIGSEDNPNNAYESFNGLPLTDELKARFDKHFGRNSRQYQWLVKDLADANRRRDKVPWILLFTHRPIYHTSTHHPACGVGGDWYVCLFRDTYEPILRQFGVDIVSSGHSHHYSRSKPMYANKVDLEKGVVHTTVGTGGYGLTDHFSAKPDWIAFRQGSQFGYVRFIVKNSTHAKWTFLSPTNEGESTVGEDVWIVRRDD